ncbi:hypothetical protein [uncultured Helicobacter sp.]|uniref:hypothetical protein n=1 Tax=uncultured Helicobacter sp. TaxID=175537 RepID=UPI00261639A1|nr:hypothetical protein [uncultured Helicobacter sp.]
MPVLSTGFSSLRYKKQTNIFIPPPLFFFLQRSERHIFEAGVGTIFSLFLSHLNAALRFALTQNFSSNLTHYCINSFIFKFINA